MHFQKSRWPEPCSWSLMWPSSNISMERKLVCDFQHIKNQASIVLSSPIWPLIFSQSYCQWGSIFWMSIESQIYSRHQVELIYIIHCLRCTGKMVSSLYHPRTYLTPIMLYIYKLKLLNALFPLYSLDWFQNWLQTCGVRLIFHTETSFLQIQYNKPITNLLIFPWQIFR